MVADFPRASSDGTIRLRHAHGVRLDFAGRDARGHTIYVKADVRVRAKMQTVRYNESGRTGTIHPAKFGRVVPTVYCCRKANVPVGILKFVAPPPTPTWQVLGG
jgi:hypothetical protein